MILCQITGFLFSERHHKQITRATAGSQNFYQKDGDGKVANHIDLTSLLIFAFLKNQGTAATHLNFSCWISMTHLIGFIWFQNMIWFINIIRQFPIYSLIFEPNLRPLRSLARNWSVEKTLNLPQVEAVKWTDIALQFFMPETSIKKAKIESECWKLLRP